MLNRRNAIAACAVAMIVFAILCYSAVLTKSITYDETLHVVSGWTHFYLRDFRIDFDNPPLPKYWASVLGFSDPLRIDLRDPDWIAVSGDFYREWDVAARALYHTSEVDPIVMVNRARFMMLSVSVLLGIVTAMFAWRVAGTKAALVAAGLFALDPNFLGHGALVKNDVPMALMLLAVMFICWEAGRKLTWKHASLLCVAVAIAVNAKFSALLIGPMLLLLLGIRTVLPIPWNALGRRFDRFRGKLALAILLLIGIGIASYVGIWASYGFHFSPSLDPSAQLDPDARLRELIYFRYEAAHPQPRPAPMDPTASIEVLRTVLAHRLETLSNAVNEARSRAPQRPPALGSQAAAWLQNAMQVQAQIRAMLDETAAASAAMSASTQPELKTAMHQSDVDAQACEFQLGEVVFAGLLPDHGETRFFRIAKLLLQRRLLPAPWIHGLLVQYSHSRARTNFLLGKVRDVGTWYYFPLAMLVKTPIATQLALLAACAIAIWSLGTNWARRLEFAWPLACLAVPVAIYMTSAMTSNLNIGIRHVLPIYPLLYVATGACFAIAIQRWRKPAVIALSILGVILLTETLLAWPNYIAYFNVAAGRSRGGFKLLGDSNLDWGQDLPLLASWQRQHPGAPLALCYFGTADPVAYDIQAIPLPAWPPPQELLDNCVIAISATHLQGIHTSSFIGYQSLEPTEVLGGTIYLYDRRSRQP